MFEINNDFARLLITAKHGDALSQNEKDRILAKALALPAHPDRHVCVTYQQHGGKFRKIFYGPDWSAATFMDTFKFGNDTYTFAVCCHSGTVDVCIDDVVILRSQDYEVCRACSILPSDRSVRDFRYPILFNKYFEGRVLL